MSDNTYPARVHTRYYRTQDMVEVLGYVEDTIVIRYLRKRHGKDYKWELDYIIEKPTYTMEWMKYYTQAIGMSYARTTHIGDDKISF